MAIAPPPGDPRSSRPPGNRPHAGVADSGPVRRCRSRVTVVSPAYWPQGGGSHPAADIATATAQMLTDAGASVRVVAPRTSAHMHTSLRRLGVDVRRPMQPPRSQWASRRYGRSLTQWLIENVSDADVILAIGIGEESRAASDAADRIGVPFWFRPGGGSDGECPADLRPGLVRGGGSMRRWSAAAAADGWIVGTAAERRDWTARGVPPASLNVWPWPVRRIPSERPVRIDRPRARHTLGTANADLRTDDDTPVVATATRLARGTGIDDVVEAMTAVLSHRPDVRFWMIGDGPSRSRIYGRLRGDGYRQHVAMPGSWPSAHEVWAACDVYVHVDPIPGPTLADVVAAGCPVVSLDTAANREFMAATFGDGCRGSNATAGESPVREPVGTPVQWTVGDPPSIRRGVRAFIDRPPRRFFPDTPIGPGVVEPGVADSGVAEPGVVDSTGGDHAPVHRWLAEHAGAWR